MDRRDGSYEGGSDGEGAGAKLKSRGDCSGVASKEVELEGTRERSQSSLHSSCMAAASSSVWLRSTGEPERREAAGEGRQGVRPGELKRLTSEKLGWRCGWREDGLGGKTKVYPVRALGGLDS